MEKESGAEENFVLLFTKQMGQIVIDLNGAKIYAVSQMNIEPSITPPTP